MDFLTGIWAYVVPFLVIFTLVVFVHELGHYLVARRCGVRVEVFSIGFGPEIFGRTDRAGTRWKVSAVPLGGYVKMFGEATGEEEEEVVPAKMTAEERAVSFQEKSLLQRVAIVSAGPLSNFVFAMVVLAALFNTAGQPFTPPYVTGVQPTSPAAIGGLKEGDMILEIGGHTIRRFEDIQHLVRENPGVRLDVVVRRNGTEVPLTVIPEVRKETDRFGYVRKIGRLGIYGGSRQYVRRDLPAAIGHAVQETVFLTGATLSAVGQIILGTRTTDELGGPLRIAQVSAEMAQVGLVPSIWFLAVLSINLGLINLFPIPLLDGGHLLFYAAEAVRGRPIGPRAREVGFAIGLAVILALMLFVTWNDLVHLKVVEFFKGLFT